MIEEQIKQNAEEWADEQKHTNSTIYVARYCAFIAGAHSRDEEIKQLKDRLMFADESIADAGKWIAKYKLDIANLEAKLNQLRNPWISVEERLPEEKQAVFIIERCLKEKGVVIQHFDVAVYIRNTFICQFETYRDPIVTHWMPVPEVPKPELPK